MPMILNDYQFNYTLIGDRKQPVILFLHGFMGNGDDFLQVIDLISAKFCCLVIDLPGHGITEVSQDSNYQMPNVAQALIELLEQLKIKPCFLVGYSMGGRIALYLTIHFPEYFRGVILESASPGLKTQLERDRRIKQDLKRAKKLETIENQDFSLFLKQWYSSPLFGNFANHPNYQKAIARRLKNSPYKLAKSLRNIGLGMQPSLWHKLGGNQVPLMLVVGERDRKFIAINQKIVNLDPHCNLNMVNNCGHNVHFEQPLKFAKIIEREFDVILLVK